jgi:hypothetical protein
MLISLLNQCKLFPNSKSRLQRARLGLCPRVLFIETGDRR